MKEHISGIILKLASAVSALAETTATNNLQNTCLFLTYQPDVPSDIEDAK